MKPEWIRQHEVSARAGREVMTTGDWATRIGLRLAELVDLEQTNQLNDEQRVELTAFRVQYGLISRQFASWL